MSFQPYLVQDALCLMEMSFKTAAVTDTELDWRPEKFAYYYWPAESDENCRLSATSERPDSAVLTNDPVPAAAMKEIIYGAEELLSLALNYAINEQDYEGGYPAGSDMPERIRREFRSYQADSTIRLRGVDLMARTVPGSGFAYQATFGGPQSKEGPSVTFSVTRQGFVIHGVGQWIV